MHLFIRMCLKGRQPFSAAAVMRDLLRRCSQKGYKVVCQPMTAGLQELLGQHCAWAARPREGRLMLLRYLKAKRKEAGGACK